MNAEGGILTKPTIFGMSGSTLLGGGEAGKEVVAPIDTLQTYIRQAVAVQTDGIIDLLMEILALMRQFYPRMGGSEIRLDSGVLVGELAPAIDTALGTLERRKRRGNV